MLAVEAKFAVFTVRACADEVAEVAVIGIEAERKTFIAKFGAVGEGEISRVFCAPCVLKIKTVL